VVPVGTSYNVSGTFRGDWKGKDVPQRVIDAAPVFRVSKGVVVLQLNSTASDHSGVHHVEGELMLRDGPFISEHDMLLKVSGVFVPATRRLHALAQPKSPMGLPFSPAEANPVSPTYRQALHEAVRQMAAGTDLDGSQRLELQQVLPEETKDAPQQPLMRNGALQLSLGRDCSFVLDLSAISLAIGAQSGTNVTRLSEADVESLGLGAPAETQGPKSPQAEAALPDLVLNGTLVSADCGVRVVLGVETQHMERYYSRAAHYTLLVSALTFFQMVLLMRQMEATAGAGAAAQLSMLSIAHQALMDAYLCLLHLTTGMMVEPLFNAFASASFFEFVMFACFEMRWLLMAWRAQRGGLLEAWEQQRELMVLYARFYVALMLGILFSWRLAEYMRWVVFPLCAWWLPQIVMSSWNDVRPPLKPSYVAGTSLARLALPLYLLACPHNLLRSPPCYPIATALTLFVGAQAAMLIAQRRCGARCWIPARFLPPRYDYFRVVLPAVLPGPDTNRAPADLTAAAVGTAPVGILPGGQTNASGGGAGPDEETGNSPECSICMNAIDIGVRRRRMVTPCGHFFHPPCLLKWMDVKMACPVCRRDLPPP